MPLKQCKELSISDCIIEDEQDSIGSLIQELEKNKNMKFPLMESDAILEFSGLMDEKGSNK